MSRKESSRGRPDEKRKDTSVDEVYKEFLETFSDVKKPSGMAWVRGDTVNQSKSEALTAPKDRMYKPKSKLEELASSFQSAQDHRSRKSHDSEDQGKKGFSIKKDSEKKRTSNLENLKEELRKSQEERAERRRLRDQMQRLKSDDPDRKTRFDPLQPEHISLISAAALRASNDDFLTLSGSYDSDPTTTNIYIANLDGKITESILCELFGKFGPLASVKIMWPRTEEERARGKNAGFVAYMNRADAERAITILQNRVLQSVTMRLGWGKSVAIPPYPIYLPPKLAEIMQPQAPTGLPFNCSLSTPEETKQAAELLEDNDDHVLMQKTLEKAVVRVVVPTERAILHIVHRMVEFVCREGPLFEAMIMNREINNPLFRFLFDNKSPVHIYYRWKLFSIMQGDSPRIWKTDDFRMFEGGSMWRPPPVNPFTQSMPTKLLPREEDLPPFAEGSEKSQPSPPLNGSRAKGRERHSSGDSRGNSPVTSSRHSSRSKDKRTSERDRDKCSLSDRQKQHLEEMLKELTAERRKIADGMLWCLDHAYSADEIVESLVESLSIVQTPLPKKIARLYLVSDLLHNAAAKVPHAFSYRKYLQPRLVQIFSDLNAAYDSIEVRMKKEQFKTRVMSCFRAWEDWAIYPNDFLIYLQNVFFGLVKLSDDQQQDEDIEGEPVSLVDDDLLDGEPVLTEQTAGLLSSLYGKPVEKQPEVPEKRSKTTSTVSSNKPPPQTSKPGFQRSKWEEVDPEQVEAQAVTTSRWDFFEPSADDLPTSSQKSCGGEDYDGEEIESDNNDDVDGVEIEDSVALSARMRAISAARNQTTAHNNLSASISSTGSGTSNVEMSEERRLLLRKVEVQVMQYQDELESGQMPRDSSLSMAQQVQRYREQLVAQATAAPSPSHHHRDSSRAGGEGGSSRRDRKSGSSRRRSRSPSRSPPSRDRSSAKSSRPRSRSRSRSPVRGSTGRKLSHRY